MAAKAKSKTLRIQLVRGLAGKDGKQRECVRALGLRRNRQVVERPNTPEIRGQIRCAQHLLHVEEV